MEKRLGSMANQTKTSDLARDFSEKDFSEKDFSEMELLQQEVILLKEKVQALRESRRILMGLLAENMAQSRRHIAQLENDISCLKKENLQYKKRLLQRKVIS